MGRSATGIDGCLYSFQFRPTVTLITFKSICLVYIIVVFNLCCSLFVCLFCFVFVMLCSLFCPIKVRASGKPLEKKISREI